MPNVIASITMSLDGFIAGRHDTPEQPLGDGGNHLHAWILKGDHSSKHNNFFNLSKKNRKFLINCLRAQARLLPAGEPMISCTAGKDGTALMATDMIQSEGVRTGNDMTVIFRDLGGKTRIDMRMLFPAAEKRKEAAEFRAIEGGKQTLSRLAEFLNQMQIRKSR